MKKIRKAGIFVLSLILIFSMGLLSACGKGGNSDSSGTSGLLSSGSDEASVSFEAMDTYMTLTVYGNEAEEAMEAVEEEIERLEGILSAEDQESEIYSLNESGTAVLSEDSSYLIEASLDLYEATDGAFDITIYPVSEAWGFTGEDYNVPSESELASLLELVGSDKLFWDNETSTLVLSEGMKVGLGGIAKGYAGDRAAEIFSEYDIDGAIASLGGNIVVYGSKPDGEDWKVAIQDPEDSSDYICVLSLDENLSVVTSGGYERYFEEDGVTYHHILDPSTGYPADGGLTSVSIISENGTWADGLSTALFVMGKDEAIEFWQENEDYDFEMVLLDSEGNLYVSEGLEDIYSSDLDAEIITR